MADYLQDFEFEFESEQSQPQLFEYQYSCSLDSTTESIPDIDEVRTPLLYDSRISSRSNSIDSAYLQDFDESFVELDITRDVLPQKDNYNYDLQTPRAAPLSADINNIIQQGSDHLKNNYKIWLNRTI